MKKNSLKARIQARENKSSKEFWSNYFSLLKEGKQSTIILQKEGEMKENNQYYYNKFPEKISNDINNLVRGSERRLFYFLSSILAIIIHKASTNEIILFVVPNFDINSVELNEIIPIIQKIKDKFTFRELLIQVAEAYKSIEYNLQYPLYDFFHDINGNVKQNTDYFLVLENLKCNTVIAPQGVTELYFCKNESDNQISLKVQYNEIYNTPETIDSFFNSFVKVISIVLTNIDIKINEIGLTTFEDQGQLINKFQKSISYPSKTIHEIFEEVASKFPDKVALVINSESLTYAQLNSKANQLASYLRKKGIVPDVLIGLLLEPSFEAIISILAVLKAGGAYLPIDATYPGKRIQEILNDSGSEILLTNQSSYANISEVKDNIELDLIFIDKIETLLSTESVANLTSVNHINDLAYVIYTSGSTGKPKGAMIEHKNVVRLLFNDCFQFSFSEKDVWTLFHRYCFDFSVWEMYGALLYGAKLIIVSTSETRNPDLFADIIKKQKVTILNQTPTAFYNFMNSILVDNEVQLCLRYVIFGGESLRPHMLKRWYNKFPEIKLINMYGITETTVHVSYKEIGIKEIDNEINNIGNCIPTLYSVVVDSTGNPVPPYFPGELWIGGGGVCRGYLNNEELTAERFVVNTKIINGKLYKTGDLVRIIKNGELEYIGRIDKQIKIRGYRIEIDEIQRKVAELEGVLSNIVIYNAKDADNKYLNCYYVSNIDYKSDKLRNLLTSKLPEYMIPQFFIKLDDFPLTPNGKIDLTALPNLSADYDNIILPRNQNEEILFKIWQKVLNVEKFGVTNTFFELGGDSIKILRLLYTINQQFNTNIDLNTFYNNPTIEKIAISVADIPGLATQPEDEEITRFIEDIKHKVFQEHVALINDVEDIYPMTDVQLGMIYNNLKSEETQSIYSDQKLHYLHIIGFNADIFRRTLSALVDANEILRTAFNLNDNEIPLQYLFKKAIIDYNHFEIRRRKNSERLNIIAEEISKNRLQSFNLSSPGLFRIRTFQFSRDKIVLLIHIHHSIMDGWSYAVFLKELWDAYNGLFLNKTYQPKEISFRQKYFVISEMIVKKQEETLAFWRKELIDFEEISHFPKRINTSKLKFQKHEVYKELKDYEQIKAIADKLGISAKSIFFAAYLFLIYRLSGESKLIGGLTTTTRPVNKDIEKIIGCFLNVVPVRYEINTEISVEDFLKQTHSKLIEISNYDKLSLFEIEKLTIKSRKGISVINNYFTFNDFGLINEERDELINESDLTMFDKIRALGTEHSDIPFQVIVNKGNKRLRYIFQSTSYFIEDFLAEKVGTYYETIIDGFRWNINSKLSDIEIVAPKEKETLLKRFNDTYYNFNNSKNVIDYFEEKVLSSPDQIAAIDEKSKITYKSLNDKANKIAVEILRFCDIKEQVVGVMLDRGIDLIISIIGVLKAGMVYLPIVPDLPTHRVQHMLEDSKCCLIVTIKEYYKFNNFNHIFIDNISWKEGVKKPDISLSYNNLAYIIYTSGTTGAAKGVEIEYGGLMNRLLWMAKHFGITDKDTILHKTPISFDVSIWELFLWMITGSKLCIHKPKKEGNPEDILAAIILNKVSIIHFVPSLLKPFLEYTDTAKMSSNLKSLRVVVSSGEALGAELVNQFHNVLPGVLLSNLYGPTEATIDVTYYDCKLIEEYNKIPIGKPIDNISLLILNQDLKLQPIGIVGELYIAGIGVARGYVNNIEQTNKRFIPGQYLSERTMYKTGDMCRWLPDQNIEYLGRNDFQLKIRGYRIEPEEIIFYAKKHIQVLDAAVEVNNYLNNENQSICLYYLSTDSLDVAEFKLFLAEYLPGYMIPSYFVRLSQFPITLNGKLDRQRLPKPEISLVSNSLEQPLSPTELKLANIWNAVLDVDVSKVTAYHNFFDLGGHSLNALKVQNKILNCFKANITIEEIFKNPTIEGMSKLIERSISHTPPPTTIIKLKDKLYYHTSYQQRRLFFIQQINPGSTAYNVPILVRVLNKKATLDRICKSINELIKRHRILRTKYAIIDGEVVQKVYLHNDSFLETLEFKDTDPIEHSILKFIQPFNLEEQVYRVKFIKKNNELYLFLDIHHIAIDGVGLTNLISEFYQLIEGIDLSELRLNYTDYCEWINSDHGVELIEQQEVFWLNEFKNYGPIVRSLPYDNPSNRTTDFDGNEKKFIVSVEELQRINELLKKNNYTMFMFFVAVYNVFLYKISGNKTNIVGAPISARTFEDLQNVVGMFANTIAIKTEIEEHLPFIELLEKVKFKLLQIYNNQDYPFEILVEKLRVEREHGRNPLFDSCLILKNKTLGEMVNIKNDFEVLNIKNTNSKFDISVIVTEQANNLDVTFDYNSLLFEEKTIANLVASFSELINQITNNPEIIIDNVSITSTY